MPYEPVEEVERGKVINPEARALMQRVYSENKDLEAPGFLKALAMRVGLMNPDHMMVANKDIYAMNALVYGGADTDSTMVEAYDKDGGEHKENAGYYNTGSGNIASKATNKQNMASTLLHELRHKQHFEEEGAEDNPGNKMSDIPAKYYEMPTELRARASALAGEYASTTGAIPSWDVVEEEMLRRGGKYGMRYQKEYQSGSSSDRMSTALRNIDTRFNDASLYKDSDVKQDWPVSAAKRDSLFMLTKQEFEGIAKRSGYRD